MPRFEAASISITSTVPPAVISRQLAHSPQGAAVGPLMQLRQRARMRAIVVLRGTGKTTIARILARCLNCIKGPTAAPCGECASCREITAGGTVDVIEIDAASNRGINEMRELRENVRYQPARDRYKIFIIDEAHQITNEAFNALLKTIEEPPPWAVFVLCTTEAHKIPATIASRCQHFSFRSVDFEDLTARMAWICQQEGISADTEARASPWRSAWRRSTRWPGRAPRANRARCWARSRSSRWSRFPKPWRTAIRA